MKASTWLRVLSTCLFPLSCHFSLSIFAPCYELLISGSIRAFFLFFMLTFWIGEGRFFSFLGVMGGITPHLQCVCEIEREGGRDVFVTPTPFHHSLSFLFIFILGTNLITILQNTRYPKFPHKLLCYDPWYRQQQHLLRLMGEKERERERKDYRNRISSHPWAIYAPPTKGDE